MNQCPGTPNVTVHFENDALYIDIMEAAHDTAVKMGELQGDPNYIHMNPPY